jgi:hypothetical protein
MQEEDPNNGGTPEDPPGSGETGDPGDPEDPGKAGDQPGGGGKVGGTPLPGDQPGSGGLKPIEP